MRVGETGRSMNDPLVSSADMTNDEDILSLTSVAFETLLPPTEPLLSSSPLQFPPLSPGFQMPYSPVKHTPSRRNFVLGLSPFSPLTSRTTPGGGGGEGSSNGQYPLTPESKRGPKNATKSQTLSAALFLSSPGKSSCESFTVQTRKSSTTGREEPGHSKPSLARVNDGIATSHWFYEFDHKSVMGLAKGERRKRAKTDNERKQAKKKKLNTTHANNTQGIKNDCKQPPSDASLPAKKSLSGLSSVTSLLSSPWSASDRHNYEGIDDWHVNTKKKRSSNFNKATETTNVTSSSSEGTVMTSHGSHDHDGSTKADLDNKESESDNHHHSVNTMETNGEAAELGLGQKQIDSKHIFKNSNSDRMLSVQRPVLKQRSPSSLRSSARQGSILDFSSVDTHNNGNGSRGSQNANIGASSSSSLSSSSSSSLSSSFMIVVSPPSGAVANTSNNFRSRSRGRNNGILDSPLVVAPPADLAKFEEVVRVIILSSSSSSPSSSPSSPSYQNAAAEKVASYLSGKSPIVTLGSADREGNSLLQLATYYGHVPCVKKLLELGANVNQANNVGSTPVTCAADKGHLPCLDLLVRRKGNVNHRDDSGMTPLMWASEKGKLLCARRLLEAKASAVEQDAQGFTSLQLAASNGHADLLALLLSKKANMDAKNRGGATALVLACYNGRYRCVDLLIQKKASVNLSTEYVFGAANAVHCSAQKGHTRCLKALVEAKAAVNAKNRTGCTPTMLAACYGQLECLKELVAANADISKQDQYGRTALIWATYKGHQDCAAFLKDMISKTAGSASTDESNSRSTNEDEDSKNDDESKSSSAEI